jgi:hypothetical protein
MKLKIISGGQTGADIGGLRAAKAHGVDTGGCAAKDCKTEDGYLTELITIYNLEDKGFDYAERTKENVRNSDITFIFADKLASPGTKLTIRTCREMKKPYKVNPAAYIIRDLILKMNNILPEDSIFIANVAGNRESVAPGIGRRTENIIWHALKMIKFKNGLCTRAPQMQK